MASTSRPAMLKLQEEPVHKRQIQKDNIKKQMASMSKPVMLKLHEAGGTSFVASPQLQKKHKRNTNDKPVILKLHKFHIKTHCHIQILIY